MLSSQPESLPHSSSTTATAAPITITLTLEQLEKLVQHRALKLLNNGWRKPAPARVDSGIGLSPTSSLDSSWSSSPPLTLSTTTFDNNYIEAEELPESESSYEEEGQEEVALQEECDENNHTYSTTTSSYSYDKNNDAKGDDDEEEDNDKEYDESDEYYYETPSITSYEIDNFKEKISTALLHQQPSSTSSSVNNISSASFNSFFRLVEFIPLVGRMSRIAFSWYTKMPA